MTLFAGQLAYLDPGTGSLILQFIVGGTLGAALMLKIFWRKIVGLFSRSRDTEGPQDNE